MGNTEGSDDGSAQEPFTVFLGCLVEVEFRKKEMIL